MFGAVTAPDPSQPISNGHRVLVQNALPVGLFWDTLAGNFGSGVPSTVNVLKTTFANINYLLVARPSLLLKLQQCRVQKCRHLWHGCLQPLQYRCLPNPL